MIVIVETGCFNMGWCSVIVTDVVGVGKYWCGVVVLCYNGCCCGRKVLMAIQQ